MKIIFGLIVLIILLATAFFVFKPKPAVLPIAGQQSDKRAGNLSTTTPNKLDIKTSATSAPYIVPGQKDKPTTQDILKTPALYVDIMADDDKDGLTNVFEAKYSTNPKIQDTDNDGLTDYQEAMVYFTNPLNRDVDGDGHTDGDEVKNFFNPCGDGKLPVGMDLFKQCQKFKVTK